MNLSHTEFRSLAQKYVFYDRLKNEKDENLKQMYNQALSDLNTEYAELDEAATKIQVLKEMADAEERKELRLLKDFFGKDILIDWRVSGSIKDFIDTLNICLQTKEVYARNLAIIKSGEAQYKADAYNISKLYDKMHFDYKEVANLIINEMTSNPNTSFYDICDKVLDEYLNEQLTNAIKSALSSGEFGIEGKYKQAYQELLKVIETLGSNNILTQQLYNIYHLDDIKNQIISQLNEEKDIRKQLTGRKLKVMSKIKGHGKTSTAMGSSMEALRQSIMAYVANVLPGVKSTSFGTGSQGFKADYVVVFGTDDSSVFSNLQGGKGSGRIDRDRNIQRTEEFNKILQKMNKNMVVYSSTKAYKTLLDPSKFGGFSGGAGIDLNVYGQIMSKYNIDTNVDTFIGTILQTIPGSIAVGKKPDLEKAIAYNFAYLLFDDFSTIGMDTGDGGAIHLMDLNGVYIPLSVFLRLVMMAMLDVINNPTQIIDVTISTPSGIMFKSIRQENAERKKGNYPWAMQKKEALTNTKISIHFLKDLQSLLGDLGII